MVITGDCGRDTGERRKGDRSAREAVENPGACAYALSQDKKNWKLRNNVLSCTYGDTQTTVILQFYYYRENRNTNCPYFFLKKDKAYCAIF